MNKKDNQKETKKETKISKRKSLLGGASAQVNFHPALKRRAAQKSLPHENFQEQEVAVVAFGRMNPVTKGHERLINELATYSSDALPLLFLSKTLNENNPLSYKMRVELAREAFGDRVLVIEEDVVKDYLSLIKLIAESYDHAIFFVGSDRYSDVSRILETYNGTEFNLESYSLISLYRDEQSELTESSISATQMRQYALNNDFESFKEGAPSNLSEQTIQTTFDTLKTKLELWKSLNEEKGLRKSAKAAIINSMRD